MSYRAAILARLSAPGEAGPLWLPDLSLWYRHHKARGTLPAGLSDASQLEVCRELDVPAFVAVPAYRIELDGAEVVTEESEVERVVTSRTSAGSLVARWTLMPDGEWWQTEYPVKSAEDLPGGSGAGRGEAVRTRPRGVGPRLRGLRRGRRRRARAAAPAVFGGAPHASRLERGADAADGR